MPPRRGVEVSNYLHAKPLVMFSQQLPPMKMPMSSWGSINKENEEIAWQQGVKEIIASAWNMTLHCQPGDYRGRRTSIHAQELHSTFRQVIAVVQDLT